MSFWPFFHEQLMLYSLHTTPHVFMILTQRRSKVRDTKFDTTLCHNSPRGKLWLIKVWWGVMWGHTFTNYNSRHVASYGKFTFVGSLAVEPRDFLREILRLQHFKLWLIKVWWGVMWGHIFTNHNSRHVASYDKFTFVGSLVVEPRDFPREILRPQHFYNIFTTNHRWLVVIDLNFKLTLRLLFCSNNNNQ